MHHHGSCHCGKIAFEVEGDITEAIECNCSNCRRRGYLLHFVPRDKFRLTTPEADVSSYTFNKHVISHKFCAICGSAPYAIGDKPGAGPMAAVNVRCIPDLDLSKLKIIHVDRRDA